MLYPSQTPIQHTLSRIPLPIHQEFQRVQSLCSNMFDLLHSRMDTTKRTSLQHEASERASKHESEREIFTLQIRHQFGVVLTMTSPTHLIPYPQSTTSIHPRCNLLFFLLPIPQPNCTRIPWKISGKGRTGFNSTIYINLQVALEAFLSFLSTFFFLRPSLPPSLPL
jgi:hypothetical protein